MPWRGVTVSEQRERFLADYQLNYYSITKLAGANPGSALDEIWHSLTGPLSPPARTPAYWFRVRIPLGMRIPVPILRDRNAADLGSRARRLLPEAPSEPPRQICAPYGLLASNWAKTTRGMAFEEPSELRGA